MPKDANVAYAWRGEATDLEIERLHAAAFNHPPTTRAWTTRLRTWSVGWVTAREEGHLIGFVNVAWDGGSHAFLVDTMVLPESQGRGIGEAVVRQAVRGARASGCDWLHVDFPRTLDRFYLDRCGFRSTPAGLLAVT